MLTLSKLMASACRDLRAKTDFDVSCTPVEGVPGAYRIELGQELFLFNRQVSPFNSDETRDLCRSKFDTYMHASNDNFPGGVYLPRTVSYYDPEFYDPKVLDEGNRKFRENVNDICADVEGRFDYPLIVKPNSKSMSKNVALVENSDDLPVALSRVFAEGDLYDSEALVQECIDIETEFRAVCFDGECKILLPYNTDDATPNPDMLCPAFWEGTYKELVDDEAIKAKADAVSSFLRDKIGLHYAGLDLALDKRGKLWFIEANASPIVPFDGLMQQDKGVEVVEELIDSMLVSMLANSDQLPEQYM